jgi:hypothetical protein
VTGLTPPIAWHTVRDSIAELASRQPLVDFAQLDCAACHHPLAAGSWRQRASGALLQPVLWPPGLLIVCPLLGLPMVI